MLDTTTILIVVAMLCVAWLLTVLMLMATKYAIANGGFKRIKDYKFEAIFSKIKGRGPVVRFGDVKSRITGRNVTYKCLDNPEENRIDVVIEATFDRSDAMELL